MNVKAAQSCVAALSSLGFTELEASVYAYLVQKSPATGYRVAQAIRKPVANLSYKTYSIGMRRLYAWHPNCRSPRLQFVACPDARIRASSSPGTR